MNFDSNNQQVVEVKESQLLQNVMDSTNQHQITVQTKVQTNELQQIPQVINVIQQGKPIQFISHVPAQNQVKSIQKSSKVRFSEQIIILSKQVKKDQKGREHESQIQKQNKKMEEQIEQHKQNKQQLASKKSINNSKSKRKSVNNNKQKNQKSKPDDDWLNQEPKKKQPQIQKIVNKKQLIQQKIQLLKSNQKKIHQQTLKPQQKKMEPDQYPIHITKTMIQVIQEAKQYLKNPQSQNQRAERAKRRSLNKQSKQKNAIKQQKHTAEEAKQQSDIKRTYTMLETVKQGLSYINHQTLSKTRGGKQYIEQSKDQASRKKVFRSKSKRNQLSNVKKQLSQQKQEGIALRTRSHHKSILNTNDKIDQTIEETDSFYNPKKKIK